MHPPKVSSLPNLMTAQEAVKLVKSGDTVLIQGASATPQTLVKALVARGPELRAVELVGFTKKRFTTTKLL